MRAARALDTLSDDGSVPAALSSVKILENNPGAVLPSRGETVTLGFDRKDLIVLDKTGTVTVGRPAVDAFVRADGAPLPVVPSGAGGVHDRRQGPGRR